MIHHQDSIILFNIIIIICCWCHRAYSFSSNNYNSLILPTSSRRTKNKIAASTTLLSLSGSSEETKTTTNPATTITMEPTTTTTAAATPVSVPHLSSTTLTNLVEYTISFSAANGLQVEQQQSQKSHQKSYITAPISLLPQAYPRTQFQHGIQLSQPLNLLVDRISRNGTFLQDTLRDVRTVDEFTGKLLNLYEEIYVTDDGEKKNENARGADRLGILRSDYMLHQNNHRGGGGDDDDDDGEEYSIKQVELNTIASSFAGLASTVAKLHGFLTRRMGDEGLREFLEVNERAVMGSVGSSGGGYDVARGARGGEEGESVAAKGVPQSLAMTRLPAAMAVAYHRYCTRFNIIIIQSSSDNNSSSSSSSSNNTNSNIKPVILFVVQPNETNTVDQRLMEFALWENHEIPVVRMSLGEIYKRVTLDEVSGRLAIQKDDNDSGGAVQEVAVVYFRAGYAPTDYPSGYNTADGSGIEWLARERLERGCAAKCPNLGYHLAGTKKVQQELARRGAVEQFFMDEPDVAAHIRTAFAGLYSLGADANEEDMEAVKNVLFNDAKGQYVLKPQREGGGYNYYGDNLANKLKENCTISVSDDGTNNDVVLA